MHTLDSDVERVEIEIFLGLDEDHSWNIAAGVVVLLLGLNVDDEIGIPRIWISHLIDYKKAAVGPNNHPPPASPISIKIINKIRGSPSLSLFMNADQILVALRLQLLAQLLNHKFNRLVFVFSVFWVQKLIEFL